MNTGREHRGMDLAEIQHAIEELPKDQQSALAAWLAARDQAEWDAVMEHDFSPGGPGGALTDRGDESGRMLSNLSRPSGSRSSTGNCRAKCSA